MALVKTQTIYSMFEEYLKNRENLYGKKNLSQGSISSYLSDFKQFIKFLNEHQYLITQNRDSYLSTTCNYSKIIEEYFQSLSESPLSTRRRLIATFSNFEDMLKILSSEKFDTISSEDLSAIQSLFDSFHNGRPKFSKLTPSCKSVLNAETLNGFSDTEVKQIIRLFNNCSTNLDKRNYLIMLLFLQTGIKATELSNLTTNDIHANSDKSGTLSLPSRELPIPLDKKFMACYNSYIEIRPLLLKEGTNTDFLILNARGEQISRQGIWKIVKTSLEKANIHRGSPENFRCTTRRLLLERGGSPEMISMVLGTQEKIEYNWYNLFHRDYPNNSRIKPITIDDE